MAIDIIALDAQGVAARIDSLTHILVDSVDQGAAIGFMAPLGAEDAKRFWLEQVAPEIAAGRRRLFAAERGGEDREDDRSSGRAPIGYRATPDAPCAGACA